jgi:hypothetical protein
LRLEAERHLERNSSHRNPKHYVACLVIALGEARPQTTYAPNKEIPRKAVAPGGINKLH